MDCQEFESQLNQRLDERLDPRCVELQTHARDCAACQGLLDQALVLVRGITAWRCSAPALPASTVARMAAQALADAVQLRPTIRPVQDVDRQTAEPVRWQGWTVLAGAIAAMWFVFISTGIERRPDRQIARSGHAAAGQGSAARSDQPAKAAPVAADLGTVLVSAEGAYSKLADETVAVARDFAMLWPASGTAAATATPSATGNSTGSTWNQTWPQELTPISNSVGEALDILWRAAPSVQKSAS